MTDKERAIQGLHEGVAMGFWDSVDEEAMLPVKAFCIADLSEHCTWAHLWVQLGKFTSMKEAKRAGQGDPVTIGRRRLGTWIIEVTT
jgi:hypothetical protein